MSDESSTKVLTVLCIPGPWKDRNELVTAVAEANDDKFLIAGNVLFRPELNEGYDLDVRNPDSRVHRSFMIAGPHWKDSSEMALIADHQMVVYVVEENGGSIEKAKRLMLAALALLNAGGFGVKVESTGLAHSPDYWRKLAGEVSYLDRGLHDAFVVFLSGRKFYSCGMHNLGYKDAIVAEEDAENPQELLTKFTRYMVMFKPVIQEGESFRDGPEAPLYLLSHEPCTKYHEGSLFVNPFGMWRLRRAAAV